LVVVGAGVSSPAVAAVPEAATFVAAANVVKPCPAVGEASSCDADGDSIPDTVERSVCGTATCATGREDSDADGVPDWTEVMACGTLRCASPTKDSVGDGIPDYARILTCGSARCYTDNRDVNLQGVPKWASVVICGTTGCATGSEDYDGDGIADSAELAACVTSRADLARTGAVFAIGLIAAIGVGLLAVGAALARKGRLFRAALGLADPLAESEPAVTR
jgi:hypothetical protein